MKQKSLTSIALLLVFSALCFAANIKITTEEVAYLPYQPIYVNVYYDGDKKLSLSPGAGEINIFVRYNLTGTVVQYTSMVVIDKICSDCLKSKLAPALNYNISNVVNVSIDATGWLFKLPGEYTVWVETLTGNISNQVTIRVDKPVGEDYAIAEEIRTCDGFSMFSYLEGGDMFLDALTMTKKIAEGNSSYAACMSDLLVKNYSQQSISVDGVVRYSDIIQTKKYYKLSTKMNHRFARLRSLTLFGRLAKITKNDNAFEFVKAEYANEKKGLLADNPESYLHKKFLE